jgi:N-dimethylarginine dimethylaminohydrolase
MPYLIETRDQLADPLAMPHRPASVGVLMARPTHFAVEYVINPHMEGNVGTVDQALALEQWERLKSVYESIGYEVHVIDGVEGLPDLVFIANQSFPAQLPDGSWAVVMSNMRSRHRTGEVPVVEAWYRGRDANTLRLSDPDAEFEGCGDCRWHPGRKLIYGGHGFRTQRSSLAELAELLQTPVVPLHLVDPAFYHLDTCLSPLTETAALVVKEAFEPEGLAMLRQAFPQLIEVPLEEARDGFAANGNCPDGKHFVVHPGNRITREAVSALGIEVFEVDTSEFLKSGGSVFCMTMMLP